jgi:predicted flap endonuclease-1-like 5' DNA nuclease
VSYPVTEISGIDDDVAKALKSAGIRTTVGLLEAAKDAKGRKALAAKTGFSESRLLEWANVADRMRIKGVGGEYADLLFRAGVKTVRDLKHRNGTKLAQAIKAANDRRKRVLFLPSEKAVTKWIEQAKKLPLKIKY